jgi:outer membrane protein assembly factor BamB
MKLKRLVLLVALAILASVLSACSGGNAATSSWPGLAADEKTAYLANGTAVYAIRIKDGMEMWKFPEKAETKYMFYANPVITSDGSILVGSSGTSHSLFLIDPETHQATWTFTEAGDHWAASPLLVGDMVYAPNADGTLYVFDLTMEGADKLAWKLDLGGKLWSSPATDGQNLYIASLDHHVHAVSLESHEEVWTVDLEGANTGSPAVSNGLVYVGAFGTSINAYNATDGKLVWTSPTQGWIWGSPLVVDSTLYFADLEGNFYSINAADGKPVNDFIHPDGPIIAQPVLLDGRVILATESGSVYAINTDGSMENLYTFTGKLYTTPVVAGKLLLVAPFRGDFMLGALELDGGLAWQYPKADQ